MNARTRALILNRSTIARALGDAVLERVARGASFARAPGRTLVAGGGRARGGSETAVLRALGLDDRALFADVSRDREPDVQADLSRRWPFQDGVFDLVVSTWVIEHVPDPRLFVAEAARVLGGGGTLVCAAPFLYRKHGSPEDYHRFTDTGLEQIATGAGFSRVEVHAVGGTPFVCCANIVWPLIPVPVIGFLLYLAARAGDAMLESLARVLGRSREVVASFPLGYVCVASRLPTGTFHDPQSAGHHVLPRGGRAAGRVR